MTVREHLINVMNEMGISQAEVARRTGMNRQQINRRVVGRVDIVADEVPALAEALGVPMARLYGIRWSEVPNRYDIADLDSQIKLLTGVESAVVKSLINLFRTYQSALARSEEMPEEIKEEPRGESVA